MGGGARRRGGRPCCRLWPGAARHPPRRARDAPQPWSGAAAAADPAAAAAPAAGALAAARDAAAAALAVVADGKKVAAAREALDALACPREGEAVPWPGALDAAKLGTGAKALDDPACAAYREAWEAYRAACADHHGRAALVLVDDLLDRFNAAYDEAKAARAGVDFSDLELRVRDLLADPAARAAWAERFELIMIDEFQDTNRLQLDVLEALDRDNLFAVGDEFQSIYRFRHADVTIFRERRERLGAGGVRRLAHNFRSGEELLDVLNGAFAPELGDRFTPLVAGAADTDGPLRLFDPDPEAGEPPVELLLTDTRGWDEPELERTLGLAGLAPQPWRRAEARLVAHRLRAEVDAGRRPGDVVVLVRATASLRLLEQALEEQGLPTYVVGGRGYWSQEQVRDGLAYLAALANPHDEEALLAALAVAVLRRRHRRARARLPGRPGERPRHLGGAARGGGRWRAVARAPAGRSAHAPAGVRARVRRRAPARRARARRGAARARDRRHRLRPRRARALRRRTAAREPAQADAAGA